jgi:hypothetical protein
MGRRVICYLDVGSWENYRPDASQFPISVRGRRYEGFPNERWLDIRDQLRLNELAPDAYCDEAKAIDFSAIHKSYDLFAQPWLPCPG